MAKAGAEQAGAGQAGAGQEGIAGLDAPRVAQWLASNVDGLVGPVSFELIAGGHSNLTYRVTDQAGRRLVLRRPPLGTLPPGAHDVGREHRIIDALGATEVPLPRALGLCVNLGVNGAPFYVMEWVDGAVVANPAQADEWLPGEPARRAASRQVAEVLAALHRVDVDAVGLGDLGRREDYVVRQLHRMLGVWERTKTRDIPLVEELHERLSARIPAQQGIALVHGDYRMGNVMLGRDGTVVAVLDWELCALGDALVDVGFLLNSWRLPDDAGDNVWMEVPPTTSPGFLGRDELVEHYRACSGSDLGRLEYYQAFSLWRMAIIAEGIKRRYESSAMGSRDVDFDHLDRRVLQMAEIAAEHLQADDPADD